MGKPIIMSTGMSTVEEIDDAVTAYRSAGGENLILLHCTSSYPTPSHDINLRRIPILKDAFECLVGFSDHTEGIAAAIAARVLGACFIEKHFTLDRTLEGPDHWFSSDTEEMKNLVKAVRQAEAALGSSRLVPARSEQKGREEFRLSCVATRKIKVDTIISADDITIRRPGYGIPPKFKHTIIGLTLKHSLKAGKPFKWEDFREK